MATVDSNLAVRLGFEPDMTVQEIGYGDDVDQPLREAIEQATGTKLVDEDYADVINAVVLWFRKDDGDLTDALVDALTYLDEGGSVLLLTPKSGADGYIEPSDIGEAASTAGLAQTKAVNAGAHWTACRLATPKAHA
ncbi:DUF3052 domain-containing protein [Streptomyces sp. AM8-1-1]|uniref:DUF3052 domain-containing protein n=1 Tax=Streptomyces sp. AM8-1-1 TaxID=3075825 RepID=UPI0028C4A291|nr:DUF3052 domain-containing protein [Streptomyces sp. AM8-1-1]WNO70207.1 DUF3052 domain-containing protein [Streptomyces sp. AM8-1-1]